MLAAWSIELAIGTGTREGTVMEDDASRFRQYAAECRRLSERAAAKDKAILMEIADAWIACAQEAEHKQEAAGSTSA
jgi:hypothetical protein